MDNKLLDRIQALLAKAESTTYESERDAYLTKAQELMTRHMVTEAMLAAAGKRAPEDIVVKEYFAEIKHTTLIKARRELLAGIADINRCRVVAFGANGRDKYQVIGYASDMEFVEHLYTSLLLQMQTAMSHDETTAVPYGTIRAWRVSYAHGYVRRVLGRLRASQAATMADVATTPGTDIVLRDRSAVVNARVGELFPHLRAGRSQSTAARSDSGGYWAGDQAGQRADLGQGRVGGSSGRAIES